MRFTLVLLLALVFGCGPAQSAVLVLSPNGTLVAKSSIEAAVAAADTAGRTIIITSPCAIANNLTVPSTISLDIRNGGALNVANGRTLTINGPFTAGLYTCFSGSVAFGSTAARDVCPEWWGSSAAAFKAAVDALPATGGTVRLQNAVYLSPYGTEATRLTKNNVRIAGAKQPEFKSDYTQLEGGTIIQGTFLVTANNFEISDVGIDRGTAVNAAQYSNAANDGFAIYYTGSGGYYTGLKVTNLTALCASPSVLYHAVLLDHISGATVRNVRTAYGTHGIAVKATKSTFSGLYALGSGSNGIIIKSSAEGAGISTDNNSFDTLFVGSTSGTNGGGLRFTAQEGVPLSNINVANLVVNSTSFGIRFDSTSSDIIESVHISNFALLNVGGNGIETVGKTRRLQFSNGSVNGSTATGIVTASYAMDTDFVNVTASNNANGFVLFGIRDNLLACRAIDNTAYGFYTKTGSGAYSNADMCSGTGNGTALFGADSGGHFNSNMVITSYEPTYQNGWVAFNTTTYSAPQYWMDAAGSVHIQGMVKSGTVGSPIFYLPVGLRPTRTMRFPCITNGAFGEISIGTDGSVTLLAGSNAYVSLDGIIFTAVP